MVDPAPCHIGDMQQTINTTKINKRTIISEILDDALDDLTLGQTGEQFVALFSTGFFQNGPARNNNIAASAIHLENLEWLRGTHERVDVADGPDVNLAAG